MPSKRAYEPPQMRAQPHRQSQHSYTEHSSLLSGSRTSSPVRSAVRRRMLARHHTTLRQDTWTVLRFRSSVQHHTGLAFASYVLELSILVLILLNVVVAISVSSAAVKAVPQSDANAPLSTSADWYNVFLLVSTIIFSVEYALRLWSCVEDERFGKGAILGRLKWMTRPLSLIDLMALIPFYMELCVEFVVIPSYKGALTLRSLRLLRIVSFLRLERMYNAMKNLRVIFARKKEEFLVVSYLTAVVVLTAAIMIFFLEHEAQPAVFSSIGVCGWWAIETITSLGYGDIVPVTSMGRVFGAMLALWGIILFTIPGAVLGSGFIEVMLEKQRQDEAEAYSLELAGSSVQEDAPLFLGDLTDDERDGSNADEQDVHAALLSPFSGASSTASAPRVAAARMKTMEGKMDAIMAAQRQLQEQFCLQQQQLERLSWLVEVALGATSVPPSSDEAASPAPVATLD